MSRPIQSGRARLLAAAVGLLAAGPAFGHDFWIQPDQFRNAAGAPVAITLQVGHGEDRQRSQIPRRRIARFAAIGPGSREIDLKDSLDLGGNTTDGVFGFDAPGAYVVVMATDSGAQSHLPADRFNQYLDEEGLTPAINLRRRTGRTDAAGSEIYGRRAKSIIIVGSPSPEAQAHVTQPAGLMLEIVPEVEPAAFSGSAHLPVRVYYEGAPLAGALVKLTDLANDDAPVARQRTDSSGRTAFEIPRYGSWLLSVVWTKILPPGSETDYETIFSSLSFAVQPD